VVALGVVCAWLSLQIAAYDARAIAAYDSVPQCSWPPGGPTAYPYCRDEPVGQITRTFVAGRWLGVDVAVGGPGIMSSLLDQAYEAQWRHFREGDVVAVETWNDRIVVVAGLKTRDNPDTFPVTAYYIATAIAGGLSLALSVGFVWQLRRLRYQRVEIEPA
jgi:hypothetical protein